MSEGQRILCFPCVVLFRLFLGIGSFLILCLIWPIFLYRYLLSVMAPTFRPDLGVIISPQSRFYVPASNPRFNMIIKFRLSGKLDYPRLVTQVTERCILLRDKTTGKFQYPEFQQYVTGWLGYSFWKNEEQFQICQHVRHLVLEDEKDLEQECQTAIETPFSLDRSPWEATFVEIKENPDLHYIWFKYQHVLGDGDSLARAFMCAADSELPQFQRRPEVSLSYWSQVLKTINFILTYFRVLHNIVRPVPAPWDSRDLAPISFTTSIDTVPLSLIKGLSRKFEVSVFTILISMVAGAIRRKFLNEEASELPNNLRGVTPVPLPHPLNNLVNKFLLFQFTYPIDNIDVGGRVAAVEKQIQLERQMKTSLVLRFVTLLIGSLPQGISVSPSRSFSNPVSIFPGPTAPVSFGGNVVEDITFAMNDTFNAYSLRITILSYNGQFRSYIFANGKICPSQRSVDEFSGYMLEELKEMDSTSSNPKLESV